ncbi:ATP-binding protein [Leptolyngbya sp. 'hensonii']|uniref:slr1658 superfamily regulator n=1 Tax=Leptolyngbya sp. 'hensonii' TaxID=1922337 RepID=UPI00094F8960|nr:ATP-binding protein [Leptolyngbya sp. 'hensonii']OLP17641.1 ATP-binding protein [Leptolyngbya sp. 'hensonii']
MLPTSTLQIYGEFTEEIPPSEEYLTLHFSPNSAARKRRWGNFGLSADFLGDYFAAFFPGDEVPESKINLRDTVKAAVSFIANELLENAVKFNEDAANCPVSISLHLYEREIIFCVVNYANPTIAETYQTFIRELLNSDLDEFYTQQLEKAATGMSGSSMGLLTMINDYAARFGWKFQPFEPYPDVIEVRVLVRLDL